MLATEQSCAACGQENRPTAWSCTHCGGSLRDAGPGPSSPLRRAPAPQQDPAPPRRAPGRGAQYFSPGNALISLLVGALLCVFDSMGGIGHMLLGFLATLAHEMGHAATATFLGAPSFPVIRLDGHAAALHRGQLLWLAIAIWLFLGYLAWTFRQQGEAWRGLAITCALYPLVAFTGIWEAVVLLAGHGGELALAVVFFWRAWTGGCTESAQERHAYAGVAWFLAGNNLWFHWRLMTDRGFQTTYLSNGSFGLENDYVRIARDWFGASLPGLAGLMLALNLAVLGLLAVLALRSFHGQQAIPRQPPA